MAVKRKRLTNTLDDLTLSERAVASLVGEGLSNAQIATKLRITESTVKKHVSAALLKLQLESRTQLMRSVLTCPECGGRLEVDVDPVAA